MDELNVEALERIPIPEGLENRLSKKIDEWEQAEKKAKRRHLQPRTLRYAAVAASVALVFGIGLHFLQRDNSLDSAVQDTYQDPVVARQEAERALQLLAMNLSKGMEHLEKARHLTEKTEQTLNEQLKILK